MQVVSIQILSTINIQKNYTHSRVLRLVSIFVQSFSDGKDIQDITSFEFHPSPDQHGDPNDIDDEGILDQLHKRSSFKDGPYFVPEEPPLKVSDFFSGSLDSADTFSSFASRLVVD